MLLDVAHRLPLTPGPSRTLPRQAALRDLPTLPDSRGGLGHGPGHRDHHRLQSPPVNLPGPPTHDAWSLDMRAIANIGKRGECGFVGGVEGM